MTPVEIRLQCLALARPADLRNEHDPAQIVGRARQFLAFVMEGAPAEPVSSQSTLKLPAQGGDRQRASKT